MATVKAAVAALSAGKMTDEQAIKAIVKSVRREPKKPAKEIGTSMVTGDDSVGDNDFLQVQFAKDTGDITPEQFTAILNAL